MSAFTSGALPNILFGVTTGLSVAYHVATLVCALRWRLDSRRRESLAADQLGILPPVTIFKPLRGSDPEHEANLRSFCLLDYPDYQVIFGALDADDPGLVVARALRDEFGDRVAVVEGGEVRGRNLKVSTLLAMLPHAKHNLFVLSDSDMRVDRSYLRTIVAPFGDARTELVTCPYRGLNPMGAAGVFEALGIGAEFIPSSFLAYYAFKVRFAFGSTIALSRATLNRIGGLKELKDILADDYALAERTARAGGHVHLSSYVVDDALGREPARSVFKRRLRWSRTSRALSPGPYFGLFITFTTPLALAGATLAGLSTLWIWVAAVIGLRIGIGAAITSMLTRDREALRWMWLLPIGEVISAAIWLMSLVSRRVSWRGEEFTIARDGTLEPIQN